MKIIVNKKECNLVTYSNQSLGTYGKITKHAFIVIHGNNRNAHDYLQYLCTAAGTTSKSNMLIIAPQFPTIDDIRTQSSHVNPLYWSSHGWKIGNKSMGECRISSFAVLEQVITQIIRTTPYLESICIIGHSAGGQFVNRFAAGNSIEDLYPSIQFRYAIANPSSYLYFSPERAVQSIKGKFQIPLTSPAYDEYKYGIASIPNTKYMSDVGKEELARRYSQRKVNYFLGSNDIFKDSELDINPPAMLQGNNRFERGNIYFDYLIHFFGHQIQENHRKIILPGVGHSPIQVFNSEAFLNYLSNHAIKPSYGISPPTRELLTSCCHSSGLETQPQKLVTRQYRRPEKKEERNPIISMIRRLV